MEKSVIRGADLLISPSHYFIKEAKKRMPWREIQEHYLPNPIEIPEIQDNDFSYEENYIACFGKLSPLKGTFELLHYFDNLWKKGFQHPLHIIGGTQQIFHAEGLTMEEIVKRKWSTYIEKGLLVLRGEFSPEEARSQLKRAHVVLVSSIFDNFPYTVLEAMSMGKVILASTQGGQTEMIDDGENGFLFDHYKNNDFENKLLHILSLNAEHLKRVSSNAIKKVKNNFTPEVLYKKKIELLGTYIRENKPGTNFPFIGSDIVHTNNSDIPNNNLLSIVVPYFNMELYIEDCVKSILNSEYPHKEIIIINDGSTSKEGIEKLSRIEKKYPVKVYHKGNEGLSIARNYGANCANGDYLAFLDADDTVDTTYYSKAVKVLNHYSNIHFVGCWIKYFGNSNNCWPAFNPEPPYLLAHNMVNSSSLVYKRTSFLESGQNDPALIYGMEDWESVINMVKNGFYGVVLPELLFNYRVRKNSMARAFTRTKRLYLNQLIAAKHKDYYSKYAVEIAGLLNANGSGIDFDNPTFETKATTIFPINNIFKERLKERIKQNKHVRKIAYKIYKRIKN
jgi:glycosyltransferase involved in cell wall biosynthesis